ANGRPVEAGRHLLDVSRFAGAVVAGDDDPTIVRKAGEDGERRRLVEPVVGIDVRDMLIGLRIGRHLHIAVETKELADRHLHVGEAGDLLGCGGHCSSVVSERPRPVRSMECGADSAANLAESREAAKDGAPWAENLVISNKY